MINALIRIAVFPAAIVVGMATVLASFADEDQAVWKPTQNVPLNYEIEFVSKPSKFATKYRVRLDIVLTLEKPNKDGDLEALLTVKRLRFAYAGYEYDSDQETPKRGPGKAMSNMFGPVVGFKWSVLIESNGKIKRAPIPDGMAGLNTPIAREFGGDIGRMFTDEDLADLIISPITVLPSEAIRNDLAWKTNRRFSMYDLQTSDEYIDPQVSQDSKFLSGKLKLTCAKNESIPLRISETKGQYRFDLTAGALESLTRTTRWNLVDDDFFVEEELNIKRSHGDLEASKTKK